MDKLSVMHAFCRIVERGSFTRAAEDLGVSGTLLSREIKLLEQSLGCTLLNRTTRSMSVTEPGRAYYQASREIVESVGRLDERIRASTGAVRGHLKVNVPVSFGQVVIAPLLPRFLADHPELTVTLSFDDHVIDLVEEGFDLSIRIRVDLPDSTLFARPIATVKQRIFASSAYLDRAGPPEIPSDLARHTVLGFGLAAHHKTWDLIHQTGGETVRLDMAPRMSVGNSLVLRDMLIAGQGIGTLPDFIADPAVADGRLQRVLPAYALPNRNVYAVTGARLSASAGVAAFVGALRVALDPVD